MPDNRRVLSIIVYRRLSTLVSEVHAMLARVEGDAPADEVSRRINAINNILHDLEGDVGAGHTGAFVSFARHLYWIQRRHFEQKPEEYAGDIVDIREHDLPGVIKAVESWAEHALDAGLVKAITASWEARHFGSAVRDAFVYLEAVLRRVGGIDPSDGLSGDRLVNRVLNRNNSSAIALPTDGFMGHLTAGEREGVYHYVKGAFLLFRNATAHRHIPYTAAEAADIIHSVNVCLRMLPTERAIP